MVTDRERARLGALAPTAEAVAAAHGISVSKLLDAINGAPFGEVAGQAAVLALQLAPSLADVVRPRKRAVRAAA